MKTKNAFTLIEIMVVVAIIGILAAIIFGVYVVAKKGAKVTSCASRLQSLHKAVSLYAGDHDGLHPSAATFTRYSAGGKHRHEGPWIEGRPASWKKALVAYGPDPEEFWCPLDTHRGDKTLIGALESSNVGRQKHTSYMMNPLFNSVHFGSLSGDFVLNPDDLPAPWPGAADVVWLLDTEWEVRTLGEKTGDLISHYVSHHNDRSNLVYLDGHAENSPVPKQ